MRIYLDHNEKTVYFDATGGDLGPTTTAGQVGVIFARDYPELLNPAGRECGWNLQFYPEEDGCDFPNNVDEVVDFGDISWYSVARAIAERIKGGRPAQKCCDHHAKCVLCSR